jgi:hypothetical protein
VPNDAYELHEETDRASNGGLDGEEDSDAAEEEVQGYSDDGAEEEVQDGQHLGEELDGAEEEGDLNGAEADLEIQPRKRRSWNKVPTATYIIKWINKEGRPVSPMKNAMKWGNVLGAIARENCGINLRSLRGPRNKQWSNLLLGKMRDIFKFNDHDNALAEIHAMHTFTKALSTNRYHANKLLDDGHDLEDIKKLYPSTTDEEWKEFLDYRDSDAYKQDKEKFAKIRSQMVGNHNLATRGYEGKQPIWDKHDAMFSSQGQLTPFSNILDPCAKKYFRSLAVLNKDTGLYYFEDPAVAKAAERAVCN